MSWKYSFSRLSEEYELAKKKKQALGNLLETGKISESTHSIFAREMDEAVAEIEGQRKALLGKMASKAMELEDQVRTLEILIANFEIQHVVGEVDDDTYHREADLLSIGIETAKRELEAVQDAVNRLSNDDVMAQQETTLPQSQPAESEVPVPEKPSQPRGKEQAAPDEKVVETIQCKEEAQTPQAKTGAEEKQPT